jgi:hypothetical protein
MGHSSIQQTFDTVRAAPADHSSLRMIREAVETLGPPGILLSQDAVLAQYGPEPVHEATAIVEALQKLLAH